MRLAVINPNSTVSMTEKAMLAAARAALPGHEIGHHLPRRPPRHPGPEDDAMLPPLRPVRSGAAAKEGADAIIIACFDDTGWIRHAPAPHPGPWHRRGRLPRRHAAGRALFCGHDAAVATPILEDNIRAYGLAACTQVRASGVAVLDRDAHPALRHPHLRRNRPRQAPRTASAVVLGCAGMADLAARMEAEHGLRSSTGSAAAVQPSPRPCRPMRSPA
jgi:allantoin racemase